MRLSTLTGSLMVAATICAGIGSASAADLASAYRRMPPMPVAPPAWDWSGIYFGVNVGYGISHSPTDNDFLTGNVPSPISVGNSAPISSTGVIGGGQIGYNYMLSNFLLGVEADFQGADQTGRNYNNLTQFYGPGAFSAVDSKLDLFGTVRGRLGFAANPSTLLYVTGGYAFGEMGIANTVSTLGGSFSGGSSYKQWNGGYTLGGGIETRLCDSNWTAKAEYLYLDLGNLIAANQNGLGNAQYSNVDFHDHIVRVGLNYKLDWGHSITARY